MLELLKETIFTNEEKITKYQAYQLNGLTTEAMSTHYLKTLISYKKDYIS